MMWFQSLLGINERMKPLPDLLRTIDNLQQAGDSSTTQVDQAIASRRIVPFGNSPFCVATNGVEHHSRPPDRNKTHFYKSTTTVVTLAQRMSHYPSRPMKK
jgi:hypothetical protein